MRQASSEPGRSPSGADSERVALLQAVAACWPDGCRLNLGGAAPAFAFQHGWVDEECNSYNSVLTLTNDIADAEAIIFMLDQMEKSGYVADVRGKRHTDDCFACVVYPSGGGRACYGPDPTLAFEGGKTRAEAIARAFVACFRQAEVPTINSASQPVTSEANPNPPTTGDASQCVTSEAKSGEEK